MFRVSRVLGFRVLINGIGSKGYIEILSLKYGESNGKEKGT